MSGRFHVGSHSWDHVSPSVSPAPERGGSAGSFLGVTTFAAAELQVRAAREYIAARAPNPGTARLPRYTCGMDWRSPEDLAALFRA